MELDDYLNRGYSKAEDLHRMPRAELMRDDYQLFNDDTDRPFH